MTDSTSVSLLERIQSGPGTDSWAVFARLYDRIVRGWLRGQSIVGQDADDVIQDVMAVVCQEIAKFEHNGRPGAFRNWLRQVTINRLRQFRNKERRTTAADFDALAEQLGDDDSALSRLWRREHDRHVLEHLLTEAAARFTEKSVAIFRRIVLQEVPARQVADDLDMSLGAVRVAQSRVLQVLRELGEGWIDDAPETSA